MDLYVSWPAVSQRESFIRFWGGSCDGSVRVALAFGAGLDLVLDVELDDGAGDLGGSEGVAW